MAACSVCRCRRSSVARSSRRTWRCSISGRPASPWRSPPSPALPPRRFAAAGRDRSRCCTAPAAWTPPLAGWRTTACRLRRAVYATPASRPCWWVGACVRRVRRLRRTGVVTSGSPTALKETIMDALVKTMNALCDALPFQTSWYLKDLKTGRTASRLGDVPVPSASTRKISILMAALKAVHDGKLALDQKVTIEARYQDNDSGTFQHMTPGFWITFRDALVMMIIVSDNTCTGTVVDLVGLPSIRSYCESIGMTRTVHRFGIPPRLDARALPAGPGYPELAEAEDPPAVAASPRHPGRPQDRARVARLHGRGHRLQGRPAALHPDRLHRARARRAPRRHARLRRRLPAHGQDVPALLGRPGRL